MNLANTVHLTSCLSSQSSLLEPTTHCDIVETPTEYHGLIVFPLPVFVNQQSTTREKRDKEGSENGSKESMYLGKAVYFTLPPLFRRIPTDFHQTQPIPTDSAEQSVRLPTDSVGLDQISLLVRSKSSESPVKQKSIGLAGLTSPLDVRRTSDGLRGRK